MKHRDQAFILWFLTIPLSEVGPFRNAGPITDQRTEVLIARENPFGYFISRPHFGQDIHADLSKLLQYRVVEPLNLHCALRPQLTQRPGIVGVEFRK